jgi:hypothetical protein
MKLLSQCFVTLHSTLQELLARSLCWAANLHGGAGPEEGRKEGEEEHLGVEKEWRARRMEVQALERDVGAAGRG